jgi:hypothetical protein
MRSLVLLMAVCFSLIAVASAEAGYPGRYGNSYGYGYRSSVAPRVYLYGRGAPGLYPSRFGSGFGGYNQGYNYYRGYGYYDGYGYQGYGGYGNNSNTIIIQLNR